MARQCDICGKKALTGHAVSRLGKKALARRVKKRSKTKQFPNLQTVTVKGKKMKVCMKCLKKLHKKK